MHAVSLLGLAADKKHLEKKSQNWDTLIGQSWSNPPQKKTTPPAVSANNNISIIHAPINETKQQKK